MQDIFLKKDDEYTRDINPLVDYYKQMSSYVSVSLDIPLEEAQAKVKEVIKSKLQDPIIKHFTRQDNGDRAVEETSLLTYLNNNIKNNEILAPTFTTYLHPSTKKSILVDFIQNNVKVRSASKKAAHKAKADKTIELFIHKNNEQNNMKIYNNSLSGTFAQQGSILCNPTAHSTLTSITRSVTSLTNANTEKNVAGNRHYPTPIALLNNCIYIANKANIPDIEYTVTLYNLYIPTVEDTVKVLKNSTDLYWLDPKFYNEQVIPYLRKLSRYQLAAICYTSDLYTIREFNSKFMRTMLEELSEQITSKVVVEDVVSKLYKIDENVLNFVHQIWFNNVKGYGKDYDKMLANCGSLTSDLLATCEHVIKVVGSYKRFIKCFLVSDIMPPITNKIKSMARKVVVISDTDSTCFSLDNWVVWYNGEFVINDKTIAVASAVSFLVTQTISHLLSQLSANINVAKELLHTLAMKNEFLWTVHMPTEVGKHYAAYTVMQEGSVFEKPEMEIKGVHLKNSATPKNLIADAKELMTKILKDVNDNKKLSLGGIIKHVVGIEEMIEASVKKGETLYFKKSKIKDKGAYQQSEDLSPYQRHKFWEEIFSPKYGMIDAPPYDVVKVPIMVNRRSEMIEWVESCDSEIGSRLGKWLETNNKKELPTVYLNEEYVKGKGIPEEVLKVVDVKRIILDLTIQHRMIVESMGVMLESDRLVKEHFNM